ncbi:MAG: 50S ribosomal protein L29 [Flavobacteriales bacterium]|nr:50S ribosomal protein L29 [Flavobacteriales bacterium]MDG1781526.1 50S ribosomal protein L29 [Flavobacteriales bacterium]MDG2245307.1 50S ribosomal protein L29 [Flavobacteriales bacterium]
MKMEEITQMSDTDLQERIATAQDELSKVRFNHTIAGLENPNVIREMKKDIARLMTELSARKQKA